MNSTQIKCFISLGKTLNYSKTATEMFMSQPAVTKNIQKLEHELHIKLVKNEHHQITLTENGKYFWNKAVLLDSSLESTISDLQANSLNQQSTINLGFTDIPFEKEFLPRFISTVNRRYHYNIKLHFIDPNGDINIIDELLNHRLDFQLFQSDLFLNDKHMNTEALLNGGFSVVVSKQNPLSNKEVLTLDNLIGHKVYLWEGNEAIPAINDLKFVLNKDFPMLEVESVYDTSIQAIYVDAYNAVGIVPSFLYNPTSPNVYYIHLQFNTHINYSIGFLKETKDKPYFSKIIHAMQAAVNFTKKGW